MNTLADLPWPAIALLMVVAALFACIAVLAFWGGRDELAIARRNRKLRRERVRARAFIAASELDSTRGQFADRHSKGPK